MTALNPKWVQRARYVTNTPAKAQSYKGPVPTNNGDNPAQSRLTGRKLVFNPKYSKYS